MSAKYKSPSFLLPNELNTSANPANDTGINSLYSMDFDSSSSDYIDVGNPTELQLTGAFSVSLWMKTNITGSRAFVSKDSNTSNPRGFSVEMSDGAPGGYFVVYSGTTAYGVYVYSSDANYVNIRDNNWHHIVAVYTPSTSVALFIDGNFVKSNNTNIPASVNFVNNNLNIGRRPQSGGANYHQGELDEVAIFNKALNTTEIAALYGGTSPNIYPSNLMATDLNPIAYYPLGEQAQNTGYLDPSNPGNDIAGSEWQFPNGVLQDYVMDFGSSVGKFISLPNEISLSGEFAMSFWLKPTASNINLLGNFNNTNYVYINPSNQVGISSSDIAQTFSSTVISSTSGNWQNLLITRDSSNVFRTYVNGDIKNTVTDPGTFSFNQIGRYSNVSTNDYRGEMSNVAIWNTDQSANKDNIYNNGSPQTTYTVTPQNWWKLNADSVYTPSAPNYTTALNFVASESDYIDAGSSIGVIGTGVRTFSVWLKTSSNAIQTILGTRNVNTDGWVIQVEGTIYGTPNIMFFNPKSPNARIQTLLNVADGIWHHIVIVRAGSGNNKIYVDGVSQTLSNGSENLTDPQSSKNLLIGAGYTTGGALFRYFDGELSNAAIFNSALTPSQVSTLFNFGTPETNISFSPQAWWKLNDQNAITDSSGNGNTGTNNGATDATTSVAVVPSWKIPSALPITTANYTTALDFDGSDYIDIAYDTSLNLGTKATWSMWVKWDDITKIHCFASRYDSGQVSWYIQKPTAQNIEFSIGGGYNLWPISGFSGVVGEWFHLCFVYDGSESGSNKIKFYVNETLQTIGSSVGTIPTTVPSTTSKLRIGNFSASFTTRTFEGFMSNFSLWNTALTSPQVSTLYNAGTPETAISFSPVSWWKLDTGGSTITDYGSGGNNGTNNGAAQVTSEVVTPQPVNGVSTTLPSTALQQSDLQFDSPYSNYSLNFDGSTSFIDCTDNDMFSFGNGTTDSPFSISTWVNWRSISANNPSFVSKYGSSIREWLFILNNAGNIRFYLVGVGTAQKISATTLSSNTWYHVTATYDGRGGSTAYDGMNLYINGVKENATNAGAGYTAMSNTTQPVEIGRYNDDRYFDGKIDETAIFNTELTSAQVLEIYNNGRPKDLSTFSGTAPISWWRLGENAYFQDTTLVLPNSITGAPNGEAATNNVEMISADAPGTYANGIGSNLDILDRVGDAPLSTSNSQSYNMIPSDISPYVPQYVGKQIANNFSMTFDGTNYFTASSKFDFIQQTGIFSISTWIKMSDNTSATNQVIAGTNYTGSNVGWQLWIDNRSSQSPAVNKTLKFHLWNSSTNLLAIDQVITDNNWNLITITGDGTTIRAYKNGSLLSTTQSISGSTSSIAFSDLRIGANTVSSPSVFFNGQIDEVAIFDKALTADQVKFDLYKPTAEGTNQTADIANNPNLPTPVAWYRMGD